MLRYKTNVLELLKKKGFSTYRLRIDKVIGNATIQKLKDGQMVGIIELAKICDLLKCQPGKLIEWVPDNSGIAEEAEE